LEIIFYLYTLFCRHLRQNQIAVNDLEMSQLMAVTRKRAKVSRWLSSNIFLLSSLFHSFKHLLFFTLAYSFGSDAWFI